MSGGEFDGRQRRALCTSGEGVHVSDRSGREVFLRWVDAIAIARDVLTAARARGLTTDARRPYHELLDQVRVARSETHGDWSGDEPAG